MDLVGRSFFREGSFEKLNSAVEYHARLRQVGDRPPEGTVST